jgi:hypothetical protein
VFAAMQAIIAIGAIILAVLLKFDVLNIQSALNISIAAVGFYIVILSIFGFSFLTSAAFLIYEWWEA